MALKLNLYKLESLSHKDPLDEIGSIEDKNLKILKQTNFDQKSSLELSGHVS